MNFQNFEKTPNYWRTVRSLNRANLDLSFLHFSVDMNLFEEKKFHKDPSFY